MNEQLKGTPLAQFMSYMESKLKPKEFEEFRTKVQTELLDRAPVVAIIGKAGVGKTTTINNLFDVDDYVAEALKQVTRVSGIDLKSMYEDRINEDVKKSNPSEYKNIQEELKASKEAQMDIRKKKIAMLAETHKNDPAIIAVLNKAARDLALLDK